MSIATSLLRVTLRPAPCARLVSSSPSSSQLLLRSYAKQAGPSSKEDPTNAKPDGPSKAEQDQAGLAQPRSASAFDIDTSVSDLVALQQGDGSKVQRTGARSRGSSSTTQERQRGRTLRVLGVGGLIGTGFIINNLGREWETIEERERYCSDAASNNFLGRVQMRLRTMYTSLQAPAWEKLLPDPLPFPYQRPYTLILDLDDLLIHSEWSRAHAWRTAKRPGLDYFLGYLSQWYEIVVFTKQPFYIVATVLEKLDPDRRFIAYTLFRESCRMLDNGQVVKDLTALNRDLSKVVVLDTDSESVQLQPENAVILEKWKGTPGDKDLIGMVGFLEAIGIYNIADVRKTIKAYEGTHIPTEHAKRQAEFALNAEEEWKRKHQTKNSFFGGLTSATAKSDVPKSWYEQEKERFQQGYMEDLKYWRENGDSIRQQAKDEQEKQLKEMKLNAWGFLTGQGMKQPGQDQPQPQ